MVEHFIGIFRIPLGKIKYEISFRIHDVFDFLPSVRSKVKQFEMILIKTRDIIPHKCLINE